MTNEGLYRGRLAPSPTGRLHWGIARTSLLAWLFARARQGVLIMRVEDLDGPRAVPGAAQAIAEDLRFLGLDWDEGWGFGADGPLAGREVGAHGPYTQGQRGARYEDALLRLQAQGLVFPCSCTRRELALAQSSAPHGQLGPLYPGTCLAGPTHPERQQALRFRMPFRSEPFVDEIQGPTDLNVRDDFVVRRSDGLFAYQLAVVVDDIAMGVNHVVRGADLLSSTPRQLALYRALGADPPRFAHVPLVLNRAGQRLAKRDGAVAIADYREAGCSAEQLVGALGASLGLCSPGEKIGPAGLLGNFAPERIGHSPTYWDPQALGLPELG